MMSGLRKRMDSRKSPTSSPTTTSGSALSSARTATHHRGEWWCVVKKCIDTFVIHVSPLWHFPTHIILVFLFVPKKFVFPFYFVYSPEL